MICSEELPGPEDTGYGDTLPHRAGLHHPQDQPLALDLLEEFRAPLVDRLSLRLLTLGTLKPASFTRTPEGGMVLEREALKSYFAAYEKELTRPIALESETASFRDLIRRQAGHLARTLTHGEPYEPFRLPC